MLNFHATLPPHSRRPCRRAQSFVSGIFFVATFHIALRHRERYPRRRHKFSCTHSREPQTLWTTVTPGTADIRCIAWNWCLRDLIAMWNGNSVSAHRRACVGVDVGFPTLPLFLLECLVNLFLLRSVKHRPSATFERCILGNSNTGCRLVLKDTTKDPRLMSELTSCALGVRTGRRPSFKTRPDWRFPEVTRRP